MSIDLAAYVFETFKKQKASLIEEIKRYNENKRPVVPIRLPDHLRVEYNVICGGYDSERENEDFELPTKEGIVTIEFIRCQMRKHSAQERGVKEIEYVYVWPARALPNETKDWIVFDVYELDPQDAETELDALLGNNSLQNAT